MISPKVCNGLFRPWIVSVVSVSTLGGFGLSCFGPNSFRPNLVDRFDHIFFEPSSR